MCDPMLKSAASVCAAVCLVLERLATVHAVHLQVLTCRCFDFGNSF